MEALNSCHHTPPTQVTPTGQNHGAVKMIDITCGNMDGQAVAISATHIITADHVVQTGDCPRAVFVSSSSRDDFAILRQSNDHWLTISCETIVQGQRLNIGIATGRFVATQADRRYRHMAEITGAVRVGQSGGAVLNENGHVVAIISSGTDTHTYVKQLKDTELCTSSNND